MRAGIQNKIDATDQRLFEGRLTTHCIEARRGDSLSVSNGPGEPPSSHPSIIPPLKGRGGDGWIWFVQAQPSQSHLNRIRGKGAVPAGKPIKPLQSAKVAGNSRVHSCSNPRRDGNREGVVHVHALDGVRIITTLHAHTGDGLSVPGLETLKPRLGLAEAIPTHAETFS